MATQQSKTMRLILSLLILWMPISTFSQTDKKPRVIVLTDIEADPDDTQSLIRFLLYSNQFDVEGLVATTSIHQKTRVAPESILKVLDAYGKVQPNLIKHEQGYPTKEELKPKVKKGLATYGMEGVGEGKDSDGSDWIIKALEKEDDRPLWISVWGGPNTLAQSLWKIKKTKSATAAEKLYKKLRVYTISDQDDSGPWIRKNFPSVFYVVTPGYNYSKATWLGYRIWASWLECGSGVCRLAGEKHSARTWTAGCSLSRRRLRDGRRHACFSQFDQQRA